MKIFEIYEGKLKIMRENFDGESNNETAPIDTEKSFAFAAPCVIACAITETSKNIVPNVYCDIFFLS